MRECVELKKFETKDYAEWRCHADLAKAKAIPVVESSVEQTSSLINIYWYQHIQSTETSVMSESNIYDDQVHKQEQRTFLRERFLRLLTSQKGAPVQFQLYERTAVQGILAPVDIDFAHIQVTDLKTPMGVVPNAVLRTSDILSMKILCDTKTEQNLPS